MDVGVDVNDDMQNKGRGGVKSVRICVICVCESLRMVVAGW